MCVIVPDPHPVYSTVVHCAERDLASYLVGIRIVEQTGKARVSHSRSEVLGLIWRKASLE